MLQGGGQDNPAGLSSPPGGEINQLGYLTPGGEDIQGGGQDIPGQLAPQGASCPGGQDKLLHRGCNQSYGSCVLHVLSWFNICVKFHENMSSGLKLMEQT